MSKLVDIRTLLSHLHLKLIQYSGERGLTVDEPDFASKIEELSRMNQTLGWAVRDLKSAQHGATVRELWNISREQRYGPASSVAGQQREIHEAPDVVGRRTRDTRPNQPANIFLTNLTVSMGKESLNEQHHAVFKTLESRFGEFLHLLRT
jgi:hypothetical protein